MLARTPGFLLFLKKKKKILIQPWCSRYISALINVKVPLHSYDAVSSEVSEKIRVVQRQLERLARKEWVDSLAQKPEFEKVVYSELLELCRELKWEVEEQSGTVQAGSCMNLCLLLLIPAA